MTIPTSGKFKPSGAFKQVDDVDVEVTSTFTGLLAGIGTGESQKTINEALDSLGIPSGGSAHVIYPATGAALTQRNGLQALGDLTFLDDGTSKSILTDLIWLFFPYAERAKITGFLTDITDSGETEHGQYLQAYLEFLDTNGLKGKGVIPPGAYLVWPAVDLTGLDIGVVKSDGAVVYTHPSITPAVNPDYNWGGTADADPAMVTHFIFGAGSTACFDGITIDGNYNNIPERNYNYHVLGEGSLNSAFKNFTFQHLKGPIQFADQCVNCGFKDGRIIDSQYGSQVCRFINLRDETGVTGLNDFVADARMPYGYNSRKLLQFKISTAGAQDKYVWRYANWNTGSLTWDAFGAWTTQERDLPAINPATLIHDWSTETVGAQPTQYPILYDDITTGSDVNSGSFYVIVSQSTVDFTTYGAANNNPGTQFLATGTVTLGAGDSVAQEFTPPTNGRFGLSFGALAITGHTLNDVIQFEWTETRAALVGFVTQDTGNMVEPYPQKGNYFDHVYQENLDIGNPGTSYQDGFLFVGYPDSQFGGTTSCYNVVNSHVYKPRSRFKMENGLEVIDCENLFIHEPLLSNCGWNGITIIADTRATNVNIIHPIIGDTGRLGAGNDYRTAAISIYDRGAVGNLSITVTEPIILGGSYMNYGIYKVEDLAATDQIRIIFPRIEDALVGSLSENLIPCVNALRTSGSRYNAGFLADGKYKTRIDSAAATADQFAVINEINITSTGARTGTVGGVSNEVRIKDAYAYETFNHSRNALLVDGAGSYTALVGGNYFTQFMVSGIYADEVFGASFRGVFGIAGSDVDIAYAQRWRPSTGTINTALGNRAIKILDGFDYVFYQESGGYIPFYGSISATGYIDAVSGFKKNGSTDILSGTDQSVGTLTANTVVSNSVRLPGAGSGNLIQTYGSIYQTQISWAAVSTTIKTITKDYVIQNSTDATIDSDRLIVGSGTGLDIKRADAGATGATVVAMSGFLTRTWQVPSGGRALGSGNVYQNANSFPIEICVKAWSTAAANVRVYSDASNPPTTLIGTGTKLPTTDSTGQSAITITINPGCYYYADMNAGTPTLITWTENAEPSRV